MKAWRFYGFNDMRLDEVPDPVRREGHVIAEILCVPQPSVTEAQLAYGIPTPRLRADLNTDWRPKHRYDCIRGTSSVPESWNPIRTHNSNRETVVAARAKLPCGECSLCLSERGNDCRRGPIIGFQLPGCFSEFAVLPEIALTKVDDRISDSEAACLQSLSDSLAAVDTAERYVLGTRLLSSVRAVWGLECMQVARASGAGQLITVDVREEACQVSVELGADHSIDASRDDPVETYSDVDRRKRCRCRF